MSFLDTLVIENIFIEVGINDIVKIFLWRKVLWNDNIRIGTIEQSLLNELGRNNFVR
jgi:hypothetical protein